MLVSHIDPLIRIRKIEALMEKPVIITVNEFDEESARSFRRQFAKALSTGQPVIPIIIDSYGGEVYSLFSMAGIIRQSPIPVATIVTGKAMSCGVALFSCGSEGYRYMDPTATVMLHEVSGGGAGKISEIQSGTEELLRANKRLLEMIAKNVGQPRTYFLDLVKERNNADWFMPARECRQHNLANHLRLPTFTISVETKMRFR